MRYGKVTAAVLLSVVLISGTGCADKQDDLNAVLEAAEEYSTGLSELNIPKVGRGSISEFEEERPYWEQKLSFSTYSGYSEDEALIYSAIADSISYETDEGSVEFADNKSECTVSVSFSIVDYETLLSSDERVWASYLADEIDDLDKMQIEVVICFVKENDQWLCSNYTEIFDELYAFADESFPIRHHGAGYFDHVNWSGGSYDGYYTNTESICMYLDTIVNGDSVLEDSYFTVSFGGQEIYRSDAGGGIAEVSAFDIPEYTDETGHIIAPGEYVITFYDEDGTEIISGTAHVDQEFEELVIQPYLRWWLSSSGIEPADAPEGTVIDYGGVTEDAVYINANTIWAEMEYTGIYDYRDGYATLEYNGEEIYRENGINELVVSSFDVGSAYMVEGEIYFIPGEYTVTFYDADDNPVVSDTCIVEVE